MLLSTKEIQILNVLVQAEIARLTLRICPLNENEIKGREHLFDIRNVIEKELKDRGIKL